MGPRQRVGLKERKIVSDEVQKIRLVRTQKDGSRALSLTILLLLAHISTTPWQSVLLHREQGSATYGLQVGSKPLRDFLSSLPSTTKQKFIYPFVGKLCVEMLHLEKDYLTIIASSLL